MPQLSCTSSLAYGEKTNMNTFGHNKCPGCGTLLCLICLMLASMAGCSKSTLAAKPQLADVEVVEVEQKDVPIYDEWIGTLDGLVNANVKAQVTGYLLRQDYKEGSFVKKGQLLFQIDPRPFQATLDQAKAQLAQAKAQLVNAEANQRKSQLDVERYTPLAKEQAATQQDLFHSERTGIPRLQQAISHHCQP